MFRAPTISDAGGFYQSLVMGGVSAELVAPVVSHTALVALVVALSGLAAESGLGDDAIPSVIRWVAGYLLLSGVAVIPLLLRLRRPEAIES